MVDDYILSCSWDEFEDWIKQKIKGDFSWKLRPMDTKNSREIIIESIEMSIANNNGIFPETGDMFVEKIIKGK